jgi:hypothetical protein
VAFWAARCRVLGAAAAATGLGAALERFRGAGAGVLAAASVAASFLFARVVTGMVDFIQ